MSEKLRRELVELGLPDNEARVYLTLVQHGPLSAAAIATATKLARTGVYQVLGSLADKGLVESGLGYGSKFSVVAPDHALPLLIAHERETLSVREQIAGEVGQQLAALLTPAEGGADEPIQLIRNPQVFTKRFEHLQLEAEHQVDMIIKAPILNPRRDNPMQKKAQRRGVKFRGLYEAAVLEDPNIQPYIDGWISGGEEARVYEGELPYKIAVFDEQVVLLSLVMPVGQLHALFIRHEQLAKSLSMLFNFLWDSAAPLAPAAENAGGGLPAAARRRRPPPVPEQANGGRPRNGRRV